MTERQRWLVARYGDDGRWKDLKGLRRYVAETPLNASELLFFEELEAAMVAHAALPSSVKVAAEQLVGALRMCNRTEVLEARDHAREQSRDCAVGMGDRTSWRFMAALLTQELRRYAR